MSPASDEIGAIALTSKTADSGPAWRRRAALVLLVLCVHSLTIAPAEPVFIGDENRHVMTAVFFHDFIADMPLDDPIGYARRYYEQYPALGLGVWPPLFHGVTGLLMHVFGTSVFAARAIVFVGYCAAVVATWRICRREVSAQTADLATTAFALMPIAFEFGRTFMLEIPTLALCLFCIDRFDSWLSNSRRRDLYLAAVLAALAALTRFDAIVLLPTLFLLAAFRGQLHKLISRHIFGAAFVGLILVAPVYAVIWQEMGEMHLRQATEGSFVEVHRASPLKAWVYYPSWIPEKAGWTTTLLFYIGLLTVALKKLRVETLRQHSVSLALLISTYAVFSPLGELSARHSIYWFPAIALFAAVGADRLATLLKRRTARNFASGLAAYSILLAGSACSGFHYESWRVTGYADAVRVALDHSDAGDVIFVDGWWEGNITYHVRHFDPQRQRHVVRANQSLYQFECVPDNGFKSFVDTDDDIIAAVLKTKPSCLILESPQPFGSIAVSERMVELIRQNPTMFPPLSHHDIECNVVLTRPFSVEVFAVNEIESSRWLTEYRQRSPDEEPSTGGLRRDE